MMQEDVPPPLHPPMQQPLPLPPPLTPASPPPPQQQQPQPPASTAPDNRKRNRAILITVLIFVLIGLGFLGYWLFYGRFHEYTDDAYVDGNNVTLTPQIPGIVIALAAMDADFVPQGKVLIELDQTDARISLDKAVAELGSAVRNVMQLFEKVKQDEANIAMKKAEFVKAAQDYDHRVSLVDEGGVSVEDFDHVVAELKSAFADLNLAEHEYIADVAQVENTTVETHPLVEKAKNSVRDAWVFLQRCTIKAPATGLVAQRTVQVGEQVAPGQALMAIIPLDQMWITANYKETQLGDMRVGQPAEVTADIYGGGLTYHGKVIGIGGGTGSIFSVLPPQNATGNWIKIVQRIPVRIVIDQNEVKEHPLRLGLSVETTVNITDTKKPFVPEIRPDQMLYCTDVFETQEEGAEDLIEDVIDENLSEAFIEDNL